MIWYHRLHEYTRVYRHSKLHLQLGVRRNKLNLKRKKPHASNSEHFGSSSFVWMFGDIYAIAKFPKFDTHSFPFKVFPFVGNTPVGLEF